MEAGLLDGPESQILRGDGTVDEASGADNVVRLEHLSGTIAVDWQASILATLRRARREAEMLGETPTAWLMSTTDVEQVDMLRDEAGGAGTGVFLVGTNTTAAANVFRRHPPGWRPTWWPGHRLPRRLDPTAARGTGLTRRRPLR